MGKKRVTTIQLLTWQIVLV